jgi:hypothetical protein
LESIPGLHKRLKIRAQVGGSVQQPYAIVDYTCTDKKEKKISLIYKEILSGAVAKSYMRKGFLIYEEMRKYFPIYEEAVSHI